MDVGSIGRYHRPQHSAPPPRPDPQQGSVPAAGVRAGALAQAGAARETETRSAVTTEEREYFAELFPAATAEIRTYATYSPSGVQTPAAAGTMFDRKG